MLSVSRMYRIVQNFGESVHSRYWRGKHWRIQQFGILAMVKLCKKLNSHIFLYFANTVAFNHYGVHVRGRPIAFMFSIETVVRGYHIFKEIQNAAIDGTELPCGREIVNAHDPFAIAIKEATPTGNVNIGHTPRVILSVQLFGFYSSRWDYSVCSE